MNKGISYAATDGTIFQTSRDMWEHERKLALRDKMTTKFYLTNMPIHPLVDWLFENYDIEPKRPDKLLDMMY